MNEIWKEIKGYEGVYAVSNLGQVKSLDRIDAAGRHLKERFLKPEITKGGYMRVSLKGKHYQLHRLVLATFNPVEGMENLHCDHIDFNRQNNCLDNLRWLTPFENSSRKNPNNLPFHHSEEAKKSISEKKKKKVRCVENQQVFDSQTAAAEWAKTSVSHISQCCNGKRKTAGGYHWEFVVQA